MIVVQRTITADNTDVLNGTDLAQIPGIGQLDLFIASTQADTVFSISGPANEPLVRLQTAVLRTNGVPSLLDDVPLSLLAIQGGKYVLNIDIVTAATVVVVAIFRDVSDM